jgi:hypothetical protein
MEKAQGVRLEKLGVVDESALPIRRGRDLDAEDHVSGFGTGEDVTHRTDATDVRHENGHFGEGPAFAELLETAEFGDVESRRFHVTGVIEMNGDSGVTLNAGYGLDDYPTHDPNLLPSAAGAHPARRSFRKLKMTAAEGGQPGRK